MVNRLRHQRYPDPVAFQAATAAFLHENEALNCTAIGIVHTLVSDPSTYPTFYLGAIHEGEGSDGRVVGCYWMTPPHPLGLTSMPDAALDLVVHAAGSSLPKVTAVFGAKREADLFRDRWRARGGQVLDSKGLRIFQTEGVTLPSEVPGSVRPALPADLELMTAWNLCFFRECDQVGDERMARASAEAAIKHGRRRLWVVEDEIVAMAGYSGPTPSGIRINAVYTPTDRRGKGYASAVVYHLTRELLASGRRFVFLYTDVANPISNSIYQRLGYRPVGDSASHRFQ